MCLMRLRSQQFLDINPREFTFTGGQNDPGAGAIASKIANKIGYPGTTEHRRRLSLNDRMNEKSEEALEEA
jgi:hypothetical protein